MLLSLQPFDKTEEFVRNGQSVFFIYFFNSLVVKSYDYCIFFSLSLMRQAHECCSINERKRRFHETAR
jgi:hypothetical protein